MTDPNLPNDVENVADFVDLACRIAHEFGHAPWWRGQADKTWRLLPGAFRADRGHTAERNMTSRFMAGARTRRQDLLAMADRSDWLYIMQHHRLPTRLLDWTQSALTALFFAVWEQPNVDGRVWILDPLRMNFDSIGRGVLAAPTNSSVLPLIDGAFTNEDSVKNRVVAITPVEIDVRMTLQHSAFTIHTPAADLIDFAVGKPWLSYLTVPGALKSAIRGQLGLLGVRRSTLFPDLDSLAQDIAEMTFLPPATPPSPPTPEGAA